MIPSLLVNRYFSVCQKALSKEGRKLPAAGITLLIFPIVAVARAAHAPPPMMIRTTIHETALPSRTIVFKQRECLEAVCQMGNVPPFYYAIFLSTGSSLPAAQATLVSPFFRHGPHSSGSKTPFREAAPMTEYIPYFASIFLFKRMTYYVGNLTWIFETAACRPGSSM